MNTLKTNRSPQGMLTLVLLIAFLAAGSASAHPTDSDLQSRALPQEHTKRVLVLNSFHEGYHWTDRVMEGVRSAFDKERDVELVITYMDAKRCADPSYLHLLRDKYAYKYRFMEFDAIVSTDDPALNFLLAYRDDLFPGVPVIFCGINAFEPSRIEGREGFTGVYETYGVGDTLNLMLQLHPGARKIAVISDATLAGRDLRRHVEKEEPSFASLVDFEYLDNLTLKELKTRLAVLPEESLVLWVMYLRTLEGDYISSEKSVRMASEVSGLPTYCIWDVVGQGVVGGKVTSPHYQGKRAAEMAVKVLRGKQAQDLPITGSPLVYRFDHNALKHHNISRGALPPDSIIINKPFSPYENFKVAIWLVLMFIALLIAVIVSLMLSVYKQRQARAAIQDSEKRFRLMSLGTGQLVYDYDISNGEITWAGAIEEITGFTPEEFQHINFQQWKELVHEDYRDRILGLLDDVMQNTSNAKSVEYLLKRKDESFIYIESSGDFLRDKAGRPYRMIGSIKDISERKQAERERENLQTQLIHLQKMESIGHLSGGIAHDFKNILVPIIGMAELLMLDLPAGSQEYNNAQTIFKAGKRGNDLVKQILAFSQGSEEKKRPIQIQSILKEALKLSRSTISTSIEITQNIQTSCNPISANPTQIHQIFMNLITNAFHAVESTSGAIHVQLQETEWEGNALTVPPLKPGRYVLLSVSDNGSGIPPEALNRIFDPYFTTKPHGKGSGLGLSVVHGIVKNHKGDIKVESEPGKGTTFRVYLPLRQTQTQDKPDQAKAHFPIGNEHILLIDDDEVIVGVVTQVLERLGYRVTACTSNIGIVEAFRVNPNGFDLVLTDMNMPNMTGDQLAHELTAVRPDIPIILWSGNVENINRTRVEKNGVKRVLVKPVEMPVLAQAVREVLDEAKGEG